MDTHYLQGVYNLLFPVQRSSAEYRPRIGRSLNIPLLIRTLARVYGVRVPRCSHCDENLPEEDFNVSSERTSGLQSRCKRCSREGSRETQRRLRQDPGYRKAEVQREKVLYEFDSEFRRRKRARARARWAFTRGEIAQVPCPCGRRDSEIHIEDYSKPLEVTWLCRRCRQIWHYGPDRAEPSEEADPIAALLSRFDARHPLPPSRGPSTLRKTQGRPRRVA